MKRVLIIGPFPEPTTGVSLANKVVGLNLDKVDQFKVSVINTSYNKFDENLGAFSISKVLYFFKLNFYAYKIFNSNIVYLTPGQTFFGVVKYAFFIWITKILGKQLVVHIHGNHVGTAFSQLKGIKKYVYKSLLKKASKGIVLSESLKANMTPFIADNKIHILYNFVEDYLFVENDVIRKKLEFTKPKIFFLSNLMEEKGIFDLLEALKILEADGIEYEAKIAGHIDKKNKERIERYFKELNHTKYCGVVSGEEKKALLLWGNIFVLSTFYAMEGQPISILEAMATANFVLTTKHAGIPDIFENEINGYFVEKKNAQDLVSKIKMTQANREECIGIMKHNYSDANEKYRVDNFISNIVNIFEA